MRKTVVIATALLGVVGCFKEPVPAYKTVPEGARVYVSDKGLGDIATISKEWDANKVDYINLDRNELTNIDEIVKFTGVKWLRLNRNRLTTLPDMRSLVALRRLYLRNNGLSRVPETIKEMGSLTDLDVSWNPIMEVPEWLTKKEGLLHLAFNGTKLSKLPADLSVWAKSLKSLQLGELSLSADEMARIRKALPNTAIVF